MPPNIQIRNDTPHVRVDGIATVVTPTPVVTTRYMLLLALTSD